MIRLSITETDLGLPADGSCFFRSFAIDPEQIPETLASDLDRLEWDYYDVRLAHIGLARGKAVDPKENPDDRDYFLGSLPMDSYLARIEKMHLMPQLIEIKPYRKRAVAWFRVRRKDQKTEVIRKKGDAFSMLSNDYRALPREFAAMKLSEDETAFLGRFIGEVINIIGNSLGRCEEALVTAHLMAIISENGQSVTNAPEGIHQDGADFIVSGLVLRRDEVLGGESRVYLGKDKLLYAKILQKAEGILQADNGSPVWHDVTAIKGTPQTTAVRLILGLDICDISKKAAQK